MENRAPSIMENDTERGEHSIRPYPPLTDGFPTISQYSLLPPTPPL